MSSLKRLNFGLAFFFALFAFCICLWQTFYVLINGSVPASGLMLSVLVSAILMAILIALIIRWRKSHPILLWLPALAALPLFVSVLVGVCPSCKWSVEQAEMGEGDLAVTYKTAAFNGVSQYAVVGEDGLWVADMTNSQVVLLDPHTNETIQTIPVGQNPVGIALGLDSIWTADYSAGTVTRVNLQSRQPSAVIDVGGKPLLLAATGEAVWVTDQERGIVSRINPRNNEVEATIKLGFGPVGILTSPHGVWVALSQDTQVVLIDPATNKVVRRLDSAQGTLNMTLRGNDLWTISPVTGHVQRFDIENQKKVADIKVDGEPTGVAVDDQYAWVARSAANDVIRINVTDNTLAGDPLPTGDLPKTIFSDGRGGVWIMEEGARKVSHVVPSVSELPVVEEMSESWFSTWARVTIITFLTMAFLGSPMFLILGLLGLTLALIIRFRLESRHNDRVAILWMVLLFLILAMPMIGAFWDSAIAFAATMSAMIAFIAVVRLTNRKEPEPETLFTAEEAGIAIA